MKPIYILGISAFYHDAAAALLRDGEIVAAAQEERFTRRKHDYSFPEHAIHYCLKEAGIDISSVNTVVFYDKPFVKFERLLSTNLSYAPAGLGPFIKAMPSWIKEKLFLKDFIREQLYCNATILFTEHHRSHAASAFYPSPFQEAAILTVDGVGEWATTSYGFGKGNNIHITHEIKFPHSLGLLYSAFTYYIGFKVNSGEYKLMGLAPYGKPTYADSIKKELVDIKDDGSFRLNMKYFGYCTSLYMTNKKFYKLFGGLPRRPNIDTLEQRHMDIACSIQTVTEEIMLKIAKHLYEETKCKNLCLAGGVALNCVVNGRILRESPFENIWVQPAATDAGGALGAALSVWYGYFKNERIVEQNDAMKASLLGPACFDDDIEKYLQENGIRYEKLEKRDIAVRAASVIAEQKVLGWVQGRMEYGPRALGSRSIIGDPRSEKMQSILNLKIKFRESFRPFAPSVLSEKASEYFDLKCESPYMLFVAAVKEDKRLRVDEEGLFGLEKLKAKRSLIPAVTHVDCSARIQTIKRQDNPLYYDMINEFYKLTGCPVVINTSFNVRGEPIVCTAQDAYYCFMRTNMDYLIMGSFLLDKNKQHNINIDTGVLGVFEPD